MIGSRRPIELCVSGDCLIHAHVIRIRQRRRPHHVISKRERLEDIELSALQGAGEGQVWGRAFYSMRAIVDPSKTRNWVFEQDLPLIGPPARRDFEHST